MKKIPTIQKVQTPKSPAGKNGLTPSTQFAVGKANRSVFQQAVPVVQRQPLSFVGTPNVTRFSSTLFTRPKVTESIERNFYSRIGVKDKLPFTHPSFHDGARPYILGPDGEKISVVDLRRGTSQRSAFNLGVGLVLGLISRNGLTKSPDEPIGYSDIVLHSGPGGSSKYYLSLSASADIASAFSSQNASNKQQVIINIPLTDSHVPCQFVDVTAALSELVQTHGLEAMQDQYGPKFKVTQESEFVAMHVMFSSIDFFLIDGKKIENPFYISLKKDEINSQKKYDNLYTHYCYVVHFLGNQNEKDYQEHADEVISSYLDELFFFYDQVLTPEKNPFNLSVLDFKAKYPEFYENLCKANNFLEEIPDQSKTLGMAYRECTRQLVESSPYFTPPAPEANSAAAPKPGKK